MLSLNILSFFSVNNVALMVYNFDSLGSMSIAQRSADAGLYLCHHAGS